MDLILSNMYLDWTLHTLVALLCAWLVYSIVASGEQKASLLILLLCTCLINEIASYLVAVPHNMLSYGTNQSVYDGC